MLHGELLQVLGDTLLRENYRTRQYEETAVELDGQRGGEGRVPGGAVSRAAHAAHADSRTGRSILKARRDPGEVQRAAEVIERNALLQIRLVDDLLELNRAIARGKLYART